MTNVISAMHCKEKSSKVISQPYTLIRFMNSKKNFKEFERDLTEQRWLEEVMIQKSFKRNKNATQTVKKWFIDNLAFLTKEVPSWWVTRQRGQLCAERET